MKKLNLEHLPIIHNISLSISVGIFKLSIIYVNAPQVNTVNEYGLTPLMLACIRGDEALVTLLLNASADVDAETPPTGPAYLMANPETQHWTALTYATIHGHYSLAQTLLARGANVEGGATLADEKCTETPLQVTFFGHE